jgi:predicted tellurium resistance membrane protein TerC
MSLDNVLAVAGAAKDHPYILIIGLAVSVVLMGVAATFIARLLDKHRWIAWVGLFVILYVAGAMIYEGTQQVTQQVAEAYAYLFLPLGFLALPGVFPVWLWVGVTFLQFVFFTTIGALIADTVRGIRQKGREAAH